MISLSVKFDQISFINILREDLPEVLKWYNRLDDYMYATGIDKHLTIEQLNKKYMEIAVSSYDFFSWIVNNDAKHVGIIKGSMKYKENDSIWINSVIIDSRFRRMGYGKAAIESLENYASNNFNLKKLYVSVVEDNVDGIAFWEKLGFLTVKKLEKHIELGGVLRNVAIMCRER